MSASHFVPDTTSHSVVGALCQVLVCSRHLAHSAVSSSISFSTWHYFFSWWHRQSSSQPVYKQGLPLDQYRMLSLLGLGVGMMLRSRRIISARLNAMPAMLSNCINDLQSTTVHIGLPDIELGKYPSWVWPTHIISDLQLVHEAPA